MADPAVVSGLHRKLMTVVATTEADYEGDLDLRLEGGTALAAYHLHHRQSADLDFFGGRTRSARERWLERGLLAC